jgi:hypothetical protein
MARTASSGEGGTRFGVRAAKRGCNPVRNEKASSNLVADRQRRVPSLSSGIGPMANPTPPPLELLAVMTELASYVATGRIPDSIAHVSSRGRHRYGPSEARDIGIAVAYMMAARPGGLSIMGRRLSLRTRRLSGGWPAGILGRSSQRRS